MITPSAISIASCASKALPSQLTFIVLPVILSVSFDVTPLSEEVILKVPRPFTTRSSLENIAASTLVSPSALNSPVTSIEFSDSVVVTKTLSALFTYMKALPSFFTDTPSRTICTFSSSATSTVTVTSVASPERTYTPSFVILTSCPLVSVILSASERSAVFASAILASVASAASFAGLSSVDATSVSSVLLTEASVLTVSTPLSLVADPDAEHAVIIPAITIAATVIYILLNLSFLIIHPPYKLSMFSICLPRLMSRFPFLVLISSSIAFVETPAFSATLSVIL